MELYERYIDDSNQVAQVPPPGSKYDRNTKKVVYDPENVINDDNDDDRLAKFLKEIANDVMPGVIVMEEDTPSRHEDKKLPILDMKVWKDADSYIVYQHYEKEVSSKLVLNANSAQSSTCKQNVHVQEMIRRILNTSSRLEWKTTVAPVLTDYLGRMMQAGNGESYRRKTLESALRIFDRMKKDEEEGKRPIHRPKDWKEDERRRDKRRKKGEHFEC